MLTEKDCTEDIFIADMLDAAQILKQSFSLLRKNYSIINRLIRGITDNKFAPDNVIDACFDDTPDGRYMCIYFRSPTKSISCMYWVRFNLRDAAKKNFQNFVVTWFLDGTIVQEDTVSMHPGDF